MPKYVEKYPVNFFRAFQTRWIVSAATLIKTGCDMSIVTSTYYSHFVSNASTLSSAAEDAIFREFRTMGPRTLRHMPHSVSGEGDA